MVRRTGFVVAMAWLVACSGSKPRTLTGSPDAASTTPVQTPDANATAQTPDADSTVDLGAADVPLDAETDSNRGTTPDATDTAKVAGLDASVEMPVEINCQTELSGTTPFGAKVSGSGIFISSFRPSASTPIARNMDAYIYFPAGRVAGAPVQLAIQSQVVTSQFFFGPQVTMASDLSASGLTVGGHDVLITGDLLPGTGGLQATVTVNASDPGSDVADDRTATMRMCPSGGVPAPGLQISLLMASPLSTFAVNSATPLSAEALRAIHVTSPLGAVPITLSPNSDLPSRWATGPNFRMAATSAFPPGQPLSFDSSEVRDVLGRAVPITLSVTQVLATTGVLGDLTFATSPPTGTLACSGCTTLVSASPDAGAPTGMSRCTGGGTVANGLLTIKGGTYSGRNVDALLALPTAAATATKLRVRLSIGDVVDGSSQCQSGGMYAGMQAATMAVVGPNGETQSPLNLTCDGGMVDRVLDLPNAFPLWLAIHVEGSPAVPYSLPAPGPPSINIDELELM
jgi:hypothetical protein